MRVKLTDYRFTLEFQAESDEIALALCGSLTEGAIDNVEELIEEKGWKVKFEQFGDWERIKPKESGK